ncbi:g7662 [Coccomyxa elongata]
MFMGPAEHGDSPADEDHDYVYKANTSIYVDHPVDILSPPHEDVSTTLFAPAEEGHGPHSFREEAQQQSPDKVNGSQNDEAVMQIMAPRMPTEPELTTTAGDTISEAEEDAAHRMLLQAVADLQAENASLTEALSAQSQELQSLR